MLGLAEQIIRKEICFVTLSFENEFMVNISRDPVRVNVGTRLSVVKAPEANSIP